ncbi:hypothetical protein D3C74_312930 [compost metagenome]
MLPHLVSRQTASIRQLAVPDLLSNQKRLEPVFPGLVSVVHYLALIAAEHHADPYCLEAAAVDLDSIVRCLGQPPCSLPAAFVLLHSVQAQGLL